jgi:hypothetical protein
MLPSRAAILKPRSEVEPRGDGMPRGVIQL